ncbi:Hypothetical predicted protein [Mytilus galloprovincialis]|uniref:Uncharacterized protein n=1 Tax=Mytilus galloprovincialis TaxID=29158 RepID=A0A8B6HSU6_MYTGA|nr:Hypothetical predicted protein [Mytilus galloprovincialis]
MDTLTRHCYNSVFLSAIICFIWLSTSDASCSLPQDLRNKVWEYSYTPVSDSSKKVINLDIKTTTLQNSAINLNFQGSTLDDWTCINSLHISNTTTVVVFKSDQTFFKGLLTAIIDYIFV